MMKKNKGKLIVSSLLIVLPALIGAFLWKLLPERMAIHWDLFGFVHTMGAKWFAILFLPLFLLALHWVGIWVTARDHRHREQDGKVLGMVFWICPVISLYVNGLIYAVSLGFSLNMGAVVCVLLGVTFLLVGNYLPKCRRNRTIGIKIKWTLANDENWNATHRFGGRIWVVCGFLFLLGAFLPINLLPVFLIAMILLAIIPISVYSQLYAKKQIREGRASEADFKQKTSKAAVIALIVLLLVVAVVLFFTMFRGDVQVLYHDSSLEVEADFLGDLHLSYDAIREIEYREDFDFGHRVGGFGSPRLSMGNFLNEELGTYTLYAYTACDSAVLLHVEGDRVIVLNGEDSSATKQIYEELSARVTEK